MQSHKRLMAFGVVAVLVGGCASRSPFAEWTDGGLREWRLEDVTVHRSEVGVRAHDAKREGEDAAVPEDAGPEDYVRLAVERNPAIESARQRVAGLLARIPQVTSLDDPELRVALFGDMAETAAGQVGVMTGVSQELPFPGKLTARGRIALQEAEEAKAELDETGLNVIARTRQAYWDYYYASRAIEVTDESRGLLTQLRQVAETEYAAGTVTQQDVLMASVELSDLENQLITLEQQRVAAAARLNALMNRPVGAPLPAPPPAELQPVTLRLDRLLDMAMQTNTELAQIRRRIKADRQRLKLAKLQRWPDLTVGLSYSVVEDEGLAVMANGEDQWWLNFEINLPIWLDKLEAAEDEARRGIMEELADLRRAHNHHASHIQDMLAEVDTQQRRVKLFRDVIIPQARQAVDASLSAYQAGDLEFLSVVDNWRTLLEFRRMYHQSLAELEQAFAEIEETIGQEVSRQPVEVEVEQPEEIERDSNETNPAPNGADTEQQQ